MNNITIHNLFANHPNSMTRAEIREVGNFSWKEVAEITRNPHYFVKESPGRYMYVGNGEFAPKAAEPVKVPEPAVEVKSSSEFSFTVSSNEPEVPTKDEVYVPWGHHNDIRSILATRSFFPIFVSGMSGNGKTLMIEQICAQLKRQFVRVQISPETDEDSLIGGFRLVDGNTVFSYGPVIRAMQTGSVLLLDECDRGSHKIMCLQGVLEGKPVLIKKTGEIIHPAPGFTVIATANTNGRGDENSGRYNSSMIIDDAFIERFVLSFDQPYADENVEKRILTRTFETSDIELDEQFVMCLCAWATAIRKTYADDGIEDTISTRRLAHIVRTFGVFRDRLKAIKLCTNRFDAEIREAFINLYTKIDPTVNGHTS